MVRIRIRIKQSDPYQIEKQDPDPHLKGLDSGIWIRNTASLLCINNFTQSTITVLSSVSCVHTVVSCYVSLLSRSVSLFSCCACILFVSLYSPVPFLFSITVQTICLHCPALCTNSPRCTCIFSGSV
jgi:hypothetical protein